MKTCRFRLLAGLMPWLVMACLPGAVGEWRADVVEVERSGTPPATVQTEYRVDLALVSSPFSGRDDCGIRANVIGLGVFELDGGVGCTDTTFEALLQEAAIVETDEPSLGVVRLRGDANGLMTMDLEGDNDAWGSRYEGPAER